MIMSSFQSTKIEDLSNKDNEITRGGGVECQICNNFKCSSFVQMGAIWHHPVCDRRRLVISFLQEIKPDSYRGFLAALCLFYFGRCGGFLSMRFHIKEKFARPSSALSKFNASRLLKKLFTASQFKRSRSRLSELYLVGCMVSTIFCQ